MKQTILVIEDDLAIQRGVMDALALAGYATLAAGDGIKGLEAALTANCDLILLDLFLPGRDGLEILKEVRAARPTLPVIILTARGEEHDRVQGLKLGADDYVVKPFGVRELLARVQAVMRRSPERPSDVLAFTIPGGRVDLARREVSFKDGRREELSELETAVLRYLVQNAGRAVSREELLTRVWHMNSQGLETRTIDMHVARLRQKLRDDRAEPALILTVRGKGYTFAAGATAAKAAARA